MLTQTCAKIMPILNHFKVTGNWLINRCFLICSCLKIQLVLKIRNLKQVNRSIFKYRCLYHSCLKWTFFFSCISWLEIRSKIVITQVMKLESISIQVSKRPLNWENGLLSITISFNRISFRFLINEYCLSILNKKYKIKSIQ